MNQFPVLKMLKSHASKDQTRYHLNGIYFSENKAVATDGHRLLEIDLEETLDLDLRQVAKEQDGQIYDFSTHVKIEGNYPSYKQLIPSVSLETHKRLNFEFPKWFGNIKKQKPHSAIFLTENGFQLWNPKPCAGIVVGINIFYLAPYAGLDCEIWFKDELSPVLIRHKTENFAKFEAVVMPVRIRA